MSPYSYSSSVLIRAVRRSVCCFLAVTCFAPPLRAVAQNSLQTQSSIMQPRELVKEPSDVLPQPPPHKTFTLPELEQLAIQNNPSLGVAAANVNAARGRQVQSG